MTEAGTRFCGRVWTGAIIAGETSAGTCGDWTDTTSTAFAGTGCAAGPGYFNGTSSHPCDDGETSLYCLQR